MVAAAFGAPLEDSLGELAQLIGDWAMLGGAGRANSPSGPVTPVSEASPRMLTRHDTWLDPQLLAEDRQEHGVRVTAPTPDTTSRGVFGELLDGPHQLTDPPSSNPFPPFVGVRAAAVFASESPQSPRSIVNGIGAAVAGQNSETLPFGVSVVYEAEPIEIPNDPPQAVDDTVTVDEDESVLLDPTTNDTDPDGDPLWVKSVEGETANGRTYWEEGGYIRYIPNPDFHGEDSFGYLVTDGIDEYEGTVTVTVDPVDDPVVAFDDAYYMGPTGQGVSVEEGLLRNDIDYDLGTGYGSGLRVVNVSTSGMPVGVNLLMPSDDGSFSISYGEGAHIRQKGSFTYQTTDGKTNSSQATVHLWLDPLMEGPAPAPTVTAGADRYVIGDDLLQSDEPVTDNDANWTVAVLRSHPASGRLTVFSNVGHFDYLPSHARGDQSFEYAVLGSEGWNAASAKVELPDVNLTIYHGQYTEGNKSVAELNERLAAAGGNPLIPAFKATGAFTVYNANDSDVDETPDYADNDVPANPAFASSGEVDLMKLVMSKPAAVAGKDTVTLSVTSSSTPGVVPAVQLWKVPTKGNQPVPLDANGMAAIPVNAIPDTLWVEFTGVSLAVGDVSIEMKYDTVTDTVNATGIWTKHEQNAPYWPAGYFMNNNTFLRIVGMQREMPENTDGRSINALFQYYGRNLGLVNKQPTGVGPPAKYVTANVELSKFAVLPSGLTPHTVLGIVAFDTSRSAEGIFDITDKDGTVHPGPKTKEPWRDISNDDVRDTESLSRKFQATFLG